MNRAASGDSGAADPVVAGRGAAAARRRDLAVRAAVVQGLVGDDGCAVAGLLDLAVVRETVAELRAAFDAVTAPGQEVLHTFAVKAAALVPVLRLLTQAGLGMEVASPGESALARAAGAVPARTVLDSPAKTRAELREALNAGVALNADNPGELARLDTLVPALPGAPPPLGLRVNPQVGGGAIGAMSTATATSKFGFPLRDPGAREALVAAFRARPWLTRLHAHVGSQGVPLELIARGVAEVHALAEEINAAAGRRQIDTLDLGGGLPVNFGSDEPAPTFAAYAEQLATTVPALFDGSYRLVTEFGRSLLAKAGTVLARVEYTKTAGGRRIAVTHAGAQLAVRTVFAPDAWPLRVGAYDPEGHPKGGGPVPQDVAGPCCFAGDLVAHQRPLPPLAEDDHVALLDTGAYYFSTPFGYNSLPRPGVYAYTLAPDDAVTFTTVRSPQTLASVVAEAGAAHGDSLLG